ncbi:MAG: ester cyclase [Chloroflexi bacterium]|nr:ester cyclase [Chloroflexota bacterium]
MTTDNKALYRQFVDEVFYKGNLDAVDEYLSPDFVDHSRFNPAGTGAGVKEGFAMLRAAFSNPQDTIDDLLADGDKVIARYTFRATHTGPLMGAAPTGKEVTFTGIEILRFAGGKMVEHWEEWDIMGLMQQLGLIPTTEPASA